MENSPRTTTGSLTGAFAKRPYPALLELLQAGAIVGLKPAQKPKWLRLKVPSGPNYQKQVRPSARYKRSLNVLKTVKDIADGILTKSEIVLGNGETWEEIIQVMADLREIDCDFLTIGQYLRPFPQHLPLVRHYAPSEFVELKRIGAEMGFLHVESGPLVRSSFHTERQVPAKPTLPKPAQPEGARYGRSGMDVAQPV